MLIFLFLFNSRFLCNVDSSGVEVEFRSTGAATVMVLKPNGDAILVRASFQVKLIDFN